MLETLKHIEARTGRREQNHIAFLRRRKRTRDRILHVRRALEWRARSQLVRDRLRVFANEHELSHLRAHQRFEWRVRRLLTSPTKNQNDLAWLIRKSLKRLQRCINTRRFRVVVKLHALDLGDELQPVLDWIESLRSTVHRYSRRTRRDTSRKRSRDVLDVVHPTQLHLVNVQQHLPAINQLTP